MNITSKKTNTGLILTITDIPKGQLDLSFANKLRQIINKKIEQSNKDIIVNLENVTYIDSIIVGVFVEFFNILRNAGGGFSFINVQPRVKKILEITNLTKYIKIEESTDPDKKEQGNP